MVLKGLIIMWTLSFSLWCLLMVQLVPVMKKRGLRAPEFSHLVKDPVKSNWNIVTFSLNSLSLKFNKIIFLADIQFYKVLLLI